MSDQQGHVHKEERKKKGEKRDWSSRRRGTRQEREQPINDEEVDGDDKDRTSTPRLPKRLCALLIGFCGSGYKGMQIQPSEKTIEGVLFKALVNAGAVSKDNADDPVKVGLQRAARTDAGVHAAGNVVSMKIITHVPGIPDLVQRINEELPPEIRLWSFQRVQNSFNARIRRYTYFFPSYLLIPPKPTSAFYQSFIRQSSSTSSPSASSSTIQVDPFWENAPPEVTREEEMVRKKSWRVGKEKIEALREAAKHFEGTHNFHNFTVGRDTKDRSCFRHMKKIEVADPVVYGETEWISVMLHGQSFMLHQVGGLQRKMMCVLVMSVRTGTPSNIINALFGPLNVVIPKMPSLGLLLENPIFESYSKRVETVNSQKKFDVEHTDYRAPIDFDKHAEEMQKFKEEHIYSRMRENEEKLQVFDRWQSIFDHYNGNDLLYYNTQGIIPSAAVVKKGESRPNPFRERKRFDATDFAPDAPATVLAEEDAEEEEAEREEKMNKKELEEAEG
ncbi:pseudouridine synthase [Fomitiporia mediterranea MF3/22]|uniref:pseudouridine synthase n=1 Tax=Fomitiporia mediterranea (strain MF3/22) TaxID=694068 RepID=UPI0004408E25|nr:pseudouridine synthase [Fomitiporia mediterranea MF3/22]EJD07283.1 pseudouridine synthase [Fomitiporia mediterranea MF3/22]